MSWAPDPAKPGVQGLNAGLPPHCCSLGSGMGEKSYPEHWAAEGLACLSALSTGAPLDSQKERWEEKVSSRVAGQKQTPRCWEGSAAEGNWAKLVLTSR